MLTSYRIMIPDIDIIPSSRVHAAVLVTPSKLLNSIAMHNNRLPALILVNVDMRSFHEIYRTYHANKVKTRSYCTSPTSIAHALDIF